jgi:hypothetical protein
MVNPNQKLESMAESLKQPRLLGDGWWEAAGG